MNGRIKNVAKDKGWGFIRADDGKEYFFHRSGMTDPYEFDELEMNQQVEFDPDTSSPKGPRAERVQVA